MIKLTVQDHNHNGLIYKEGLNVDPLPWNIEKPCSPGGIYLCHKEDFGHWTSYSSTKVMVWAWDAVIPPDALTHDEGNRNVKVNKVVLSNCRRIETLAAELWDTEARQIYGITTTSAYNLKFIPHHSEELQREAVQYCGFGAIRYVKDPMESIQLLAIRENVYNIQHIENPTEAVQLSAVAILPKIVQYIKTCCPSTKLKAVQLNGVVIKYIRNPTEELQMIAIQHSKSFLQYIDNPTDRVKKLATIPIETQKSYCNPILFE